MSSNRFPGKVLAPFLGKPILLHVIDRVKNTKYNPEVIVVTSKNRTDDPLAIYCKYIGVKVFRGPLDDVYQRFSLALSKYKCEAFFRICGDSPLLLAPLFDQAVSIYKSGSYDLISNIFPRTFPNGMSVELIRTKKFLDIKNKVTKKKDREHITRYFYRNSKNFNIFNIRCKKKIDQNIKLSVDEIKDLEKIKSLLIKKKFNSRSFFF